MPGKELGVVLNFLLYTFSRSFRFYNKHVLLLQSQKSLNANQPTIKP